MTELQRNPKLISQASEEVQILDKRKDVVLGVYTPIQQYSEPFDIMELAGSFKISEQDRKRTEQMTWEEIREETWTLAMKEEHEKGSV